MPILCQQRADFHLDSWINVTQWASAMDLSCIIPAVQAYSHTCLLYIDQISLHFSFVKPETHSVSIWHYAASNNAHSPSFVDNIQSWDTNAAVWDVEPVKLLSAMIICLSPLSCETHKCKIQAHFFWLEDSRIWRPQENVIVINSLL